MAEPLDDHILRALPHIYKSPQNHKEEWLNVLRQELGNYLDQVEESIRRFAAARPRMLSILTKYERDETAERILDDYVEERLNGVPLELLSEPSIHSCGSRQSVGPGFDNHGVEPDGDMDRMDRRSVTMAAEPLESSPPQQGNIPMGPPPRPFAPVAPMTPVTPHHNGDFQAVAGPSSQRIVSDLPDFSRAIDTAGHHAKGKRLVDNIGPEEHQHNLPSPSKRAKTSSASFTPIMQIKITRCIHMFDIDGEEYIFRDARCGPGYFVIRCNIGKMQSVNVPTRFTRHPLVDNMALIKHFDQKLKCHPNPPKDKYTEEMILQKFAYRVYDNVVNRTEPTDEEVEESNNELWRNVQEFNWPEVRLGEASSKAAGKKRATKGRPRNEDQRNDRTDTQETDDSYREEGS